MANNIDQYQQPFKEKVPGGRLTEVAEFHLIGTGPITSSWKLHAKASAAVVGAIILASLLRSQPGRSARRDTEIC